MRRTSHIDTIWPDGYDKPMRMMARARDVFTPPEGDGRIVAEASFDATVSSDREILTIEARPDHRHVQNLVGARGGGRYRAPLAEWFADIKAEGAPLYLLLDDFAGASLVATWGKALWAADRGAYLRREQENNMARGKGALENICSGFRAGSSALGADGLMREELHNSMPVEPLARDDDALSWADLRTWREAATRRARWMDVWRKDDIVHIRAGFQDTGTTPAGERISQHEYLIDATADAEGRLLSLAPEGRILPFPECVPAGPNARRLLGTKLDSFRAAVPLTLPGALGCTHLNDVLRALADAPALAKALA